MIRDLKMGANQAPIRGVVFHPRTQWVMVWEAGGLALWAEHWTPRGRGAEKETARPDQSSEKND